MDLDLRLLDRAGAERVMRGVGGRDPSEDPPWADGYPLDGDARACASFVSQMRAGRGSSRFGYYQIVVDGVVVGGIGFHGPPRDGLVEVGYGVVPAYRRRGVATEALRRLLDVAAGLDGVQRVCGRVDEDNTPSQKVMVAVGMQLVGRDPDFLHYELEIS